MTKEEAIVAVVNAGDLSVEEVRRWFKDVSQKYQNRRVPLEPVPPGDLTWEEAWRLHEAGERVEVVFPGNIGAKDPPWVLVRGWFDGGMARMRDIECAAYRRESKPVPVPQKKRVLLVPADVPPGSVFRRGRWDDGGWGQIVTVCDSGIMVQVGMASLPTYFDFFGLAAEEPNDNLISVDFGKTWKPCWKEEGVRKVCE